MLNNLELSRLLQFPNFKAKSLEATECIKFFLLATCDTTNDVWSMRLHRTSNNCSGRPEPKFLRLIPAAIASFNLFRIEIWGKGCFVWDYSSSLEAEYRICSTSSLVDLWSGWPLSCPSWLLSSSKKSCLCSWFWGCSCPSGVWQDHPAGSHTFSAKYHSHQCWLWCSLERPSREAELL